VAFPVRSRWKYRQAARYIAVSQHVKTVLMAGGVEDSRISVVYDGVPLLPLSSGTSLLCTHKGADAALQAAKLAGEELTVATDLERDLMNAGIFIYVTDCEGLGSGVLLAMSAGVPVIASNVGGIPEIVQHKVNGLLLESTSDLGEFLRILRADSAYAHRLGAAGRQTIADGFTVEHMLSHTMEVYRQVLA
jgi:glycosyltransferase involved in cell wall biosynthesis